MLVTCKQSKRRAVELEPQRLIISFHRNINCHEAQETTHQRRSYSQRRRRVTI